MEDIILQALSGFLNFAQPLLAGKEIEGYNMFNHMDDTYAYLKLKDSNIIVFPFKPLIKK